MAMETAKADDEKTDWTVQQILYDKVIEARNSGMSVSQIARDSGVTQPVLSRWLSNTGKETISGPTVDKLAKHFGLTLQ
ncbi:helix-turn-helix protein [Gimesia alba]|uniref:Helix-turn-helix protein n=1 Tax=Gimesia alba TaxID=2527973 RepID=A0A517RB14_9PLAN|nr:helix-turn-helix transcriptional regulator [Gimesia alba]QDT41079.1 helix-turn-helix protein [Gimesia alba]